MKPVHYIIIGALLISALVIAVIAQRDRGEVATVPTVDPHTGLSSDPVPSKENVSESVKLKAGELRHIIERDPDDATRVFELARLLQDSHNMGEAATLYERGLTLRPEDHDARVDYAVCLFESGRKADALVQTRRVLRADPGNAKALYNAGALHGNNGIRDSAQFYWEKLMRMHPDDDLAAQAKANLGRLATSTGGGREQ